MKTPSVEEVVAENDELRARLAEAEETLRAIREGEVDAVIVSGERGEQVYSLVGAESVYRLIVETMKEAALTVTFDGTILFANVQFADFVKRPLNEVVGRPLKNFVVPSHLASVDALLLISQKKAVKQRMEFLGADGATVPAHISANMLNQPDGMSICVVATDLTELENSTELIQKLRSQQEALRESEERFQSVLDNSADCIYRLNLQTRRYEYVSPFAEKIVGFSPDELTAQDSETSLAMIHPDDLPAMQAAFARSEQTGEERVEYRQRTKSGDYRWISNHISLTRDDAGRPLYRDGSLRDITARKQAENHLRESRIAALNLLKDAVEARQAAEQAGAELARQADELRTRNEDLARFNRVAVDRELRMVELKKQINELCAKAGLPARYKLEFEKQHEGQ